MENLDNTNKTKIKNVEKSFKMDIDIDLLNSLDRTVLTGYELRRIDFLLIFSSNKKNYKVKVLNSIQEDIRKEYEKKTGNTITLRQLYNLYHKLSTVETYFDFVTNYQLNNNCRKLESDKVQDFVAKCEAIKKKFLEENDMDESELIKARKNIKRKKDGYIRPTTGKKPKLTYLMMYEQLKPEINISYDCFIKNLKKHFSLFFDSKPSVKNIKSEKQKQRRLETLEKLKQPIKFIEE